MMNKHLWTLLVTSALTITAAIGCAAQTNWPLRQEVDLSSGFGDFRRSRFHAGIDLRTGGVTGREVFAPVDGYISRIKMSYTGYGKGLYLTGADGYLYVFGHLAGFPNTIDQTVKKAQLKEQRYYVDLTFSSDSLPVKKGQLIAYSGQTGVGAPHLHFEKRTAENVPLNPLTHGFVLKDKVKPTIKRVGFQIFDPVETFSDGSRKGFVDVTTKKGSAPRLPIVPYFNTPIGFMVECYDQMKPQGMKQAVHKLTLTVDNRPVYEARMDTLDYAVGKTADFEYDFVSAVSGDNTIRRLFKQSGDTLGPGRSFNSSDGILKDLTPGRHSAVITAADAFGNSSQLTFDFLWNTERHLYRLDSLVDRSPKDAGILGLSDTIDFFFSPTIDPKLFGVDSVQVRINRAADWGVAQGGIKTQLGAGKFKYRAVGRLVLRTVMRLQVFARGGGTFADLLFSGLQDYGPLKLAVSHSVLEDALLALGQPNSPSTSQARLQMYYRDSLVGVEYPSRYVNMMAYRFIVPPRPVYDVVDRLMVIANLDTLLTGRSEDSLHLFVAGRDSTDFFSTDSLLRLTMTERTFFEPRWLELRHRPILAKGLYNLASEVYVISPYEFMTREDFLLSLRLKVSHQDYQKAGLCRLNPDSSTWQWLSAANADSIAAARVSRGGIYAAVWDFEPPVIDKLSLNPGDIVKERLPVISFSLADALSGFEDDRNIVIKLDGKWLIPEYDPESRICQTRPNEPLVGGEHHLAIEVTDRVGNKATQYLKFRATMGAPQTNGKS